MIKRAPKLKSTRSKPTPLVCVGVNDTGRLLVDELGRIWDEDAAAGSVRLRADNMTRRMEREAHGSNIDALRQHSWKALPRAVSAEDAAQRLGVPIIEVASDTYESVWQSEQLTLWRSTDDVRVFARSNDALIAALAAFELAPFEPA